MKLAAFVGSCLLVVSAMARASAADPTAADASRLPAIRLRFEVVPAGGRPVRDEAWIRRQLLEANGLFEPFGLHFEAADTTALDERFARLETRDDRDALADTLERGVVNVAIVASLRDVDEPDRFRMGVHWRCRTAPGKHYVIVSSSAGPKTLAHELGHFFGNGHSSVPDNLMSYERTGATVFLSPAQGRRARAMARGYLRTKELLPAPDSSDIGRGS